MDLRSKGMRKEKRRKVVTNKRKRNYREFTVSQ